MGEGVQRGNLLSEETLYALSALPPDGRPFGLDNQGEGMVMSRTQARYGTKSYRRIIIRKGESRHHRTPRSRGGSDKPENISVVRQADHNAWHTLFSNHSPETIACIINEKWIPKDYRFICVRVTERR